jgi:hypothetical protein
MNAADRVSATINAIRRDAGNPMEECPSCCRAATAPYRRIVRGKIVEGCIDAFHHGHLPATTNTAAWHNRQIARKLRAETLATLRAI